MYQRLALWASVVYAALIYWLSEQPNSSIAPYLDFNFGDKLAHLVEYAIFGALIRLAQRHGEERRATLLAITFAALFGAFDEWHQSWNPSLNRVPSVGDAVADALGAALGAYAASRWMKRRAAP